MQPDGAKRKRHCGHNAQSRWYSYYRSLRFSRHYDTSSWQQYRGAVVVEQADDGLVIYQIILFNRQQIEDILRHHT